MKSKAPKKPISGLPNFGALLEESGAHEFYALVALQHGKLDCLLEHIKLSDFQIAPQVARAILALLDGSDTNYKLTIARRAGRPAAAKDKTSMATRDANLAREVDELSGFERGRMKSALEDVGKAYGLTPDYVRKRVRRFRSQVREV